jgi:hypothetical protein
MLQHAATILHIIFHSYVFRLVSMDIYIYFLYTDSYIYIYILLLVLEPSSGVCLERKYILLFLGQKKFNHSVQQVIFPYAFNIINLEFFVAQSVLSQGKFT